MESTQFTLGTIDTVAARVLGLLESAGQETQATVLALHGNLGAGKTTFTQALARALGVTDTVTSPTFVVRKDYETTHPLWSQLLHFDMYRIESLAELAPLRFADALMQPATLVVVEWAERIHEALPPLQTVHCQLTHNQETAESTLETITTAAAALIAYE